MTQSDILAIFFHANRCNQFSWGGEGGSTHIFLLHSNIHKKKKKKSTCFVLFGFFSSHSIRHFVQNQAQAELSPALYHHRHWSFGDWVQINPLISSAAGRKPELKEDVRGSCATLFTFASIRTREQIWPITS